MKISWGVGITIVIILFLLISLATVYFTTTVDVELVTDNYYEKELQYQDQINSEMRTADLPEQLKIKTESDKVIFSFPKLFNSKDISGELYLYKPSNEQNDMRIPVKVDSTFIQVITTDKLEKGLWRIKASWSVNKIKYYNEKILMVN